MVLISIILPLIGPGRRDRRRERGCRWRRDFLHDLGTPAGRILDPSLLLFARVARVDGMRCRFIRGGTL